MRLLAAIIGMVLFCMPWAAGAREAGTPVMPAQVLSLLMLDVQFTYRTPRVRKAEPVNPIYAELLDPMSAFEPPLILLPFEPHISLADNLRATKFVDSISPLARDRWRDFVGTRVIPARPPLPGSLTNKLIVLELRDIGDGTGLYLRGGLAIVPMRALGWEPSAAH